MSGEGDKLRVFVAVELPDAVKAQFADLVSAIDALEVKGVQTVRPDGIHLTLKFLGDVNAGLIPGIESAMDRVAAGAEPLDLSLGDAGVFPNTSTARVLWVGVEGNLERLGRLQQRVELSLADLGFGPERRRFNPHITAGRIRDRASRSGRRRVTEALFSHEYARPAIRVESISLIQSILRPGGALYERLYRVVLGDG